jgi:hypothetical protein
MFNVRHWTVSAILALIAVLLLFLNNGLPSSAAGGLQNPGFESGTLDGSPVGWAVVNPVADVVRVVDAQGPAEFPTYVDMGNITVSPYKGNSCRGQAHRSAWRRTRAGDNTVTQTFRPAVPPWTWLSASSPGSTAARILCSSMLRMAGPP